MGEKIREILKYAVMAPSGDNSQPWTFVLEDKILKIYNLPEKDNPYLNVKQSGSFIAHGALLKNIEIASPSFGLKSTVTLFPDSAEPNFVARVSFEENLTDLKEHLLFSSVSARSTNRRPYDIKELSKSDSVILNEAGVFGDLTLRFIVDKEKIKNVARAGSSAEIVILENELLHGLLFKDVMWSEKQEKIERHGLYIKTMEFNPIQRFLFKLASNKSLMRIAIKIKFPYFIAKEDATLYASGGAIGLLSLEVVSPEGFVKLGMKMQEIWLKVTSLGLAFQPITATLFLGFKLRNSPNDEVLSNAHKNIVFKSYNDIFLNFDLRATEVPLMMFRIGYAKKASARSSRKELELEITKK